MRLLTALLAALALAMIGAPANAGTYTLNHCVKVHATVTTGGGTNVQLDDAGGICILSGGDAGTPSAIVLTNGTGLPVSTGLSGLASGAATFLATATSANLRALLSDETGTGVAYFAGGAAGTPSSITLTNGTGLPVSTGISGLGTGIATWLTTPSSANLASALTDETGSGAAVFSTSPTLTTPALGTPSAINLSNATNLPAAAMPALTGDCTTSAGAVATTCAALQRTYFRSGQYVGVPLAATVSTSSTLGNQTLRVAAFFVSRSLTISAADVDVTGAGEAGSTVRVCLYADDGTGYPGALVTGGDFGTVAGDGATGMREISSLSVALTVGTYWIGTVIQGAPTTQPGLRTVAVASFAGNTTQPTTGTVYMGYSQTSVSAGCPSTFTGTVAASSNMARIFIKV